jgi:hypothetical protein
MTVEALAGMMEETTDGLVVGQCDHCDAQPVGLHVNEETQACCCCQHKADAVDECWHVPVMSLPFVPGVL